MFETKCCTSHWLNDLKNIPRDWALICCDDQKRPWDPTTGRSLKNWPEHEGLTVEEVQEYEPQAVGVLLGEKSGGLLAIDFDGPGSEEEFIETVGRTCEELRVQVKYKLACPLTMEYL